MQLKPGLYRHYKGKDYFVFQVAQHSETDESMVVYRYLYDDFGWSVRPLSSFLQPVEVAGETIARFRFVRTLSTSETTQFLADDLGVAQGD